MYYYYSHSRKPRRSRGRAPLVSETAKRRGSQRGSSNESHQRINNSKRKAQGKGSTPDLIDASQDSSTSGPVSAKEKIKRRKGGINQRSQLAQSSAIDVEPQQVTGSNHELAEEQELDNTEFAKQLQGLKTGTSLQKSTENNGKRANKQGKQAEMPLNSFNALAPTANGASGTQQMSNASSTTGADADDDLSPAVSPPLGATQTATSGDISDMLEPPAKGASVLRLTNVEEPKSHSKAQKSAPMQETKEQRRNKRKKEERLLAREEAEKERKALMEKQRRTAREAEGRPAKNGLGAAQATVTNAWNKPSSSVATSAAASNGPLLDTFDHGALETVNGHSQSSTANNNVLQNELPSEEEQLKLLSEMDGNDGWSTVQKGGKSKKKTGEIDRTRTKSITSASASSNEGQSRSSFISAVPTETSPPTSFGEGMLKLQRTKREEVDPKIWNRENIHQHPDYDPEFPYALTGHPEDSDWVVA